MYKDLLPYEHVFQYETKMLITDISTYEDRIVKWLNKRLNCIEDNTDGVLSLEVCPDGFYMDLLPDLYELNHSLIHFRLNHVHALQIKQICEYYLDCYKKHASTTDVDIYPNSSSLIQTPSTKHIVIKELATEPGIKGKKLTKS